MLPFFGLPTIWIASRSPTRPFINTSPIKWDVGNLDAFLQAIAGHVVGEVLINGLVGDRDAIQIVGSPKKGNIDVQALVLLAVKHLGFARLEQLRAGGGDLNELLDAGFVAQIAIEDFHVRAVGLEVLLDEAAD